MGRGRFKYFVPDVLPVGYTTPAAPVGALDKDRFKFEPPVIVDTTVDVDKAKGRIKRDADANASAADHFIGVDTTTQAVTIKLPSTSGIAVGKIFLIKDEGGNAGKNPITVATSGGATIDGASSIKLQSDYAAINLYYNGTEWSIY